jgi:hypothetical protein
MWFFPKKDSRISMILQASFDHVRQNFHNTFSWINYLNQRNSEYEKKLEKTDKRLESIEVYLSQLPNLNAQIRQIIDLHYKYEDIIKRLHYIEDKMRNLGDFTPQTRLVEMQEKIISLEKKKEAITSNLKEKMLKHIARNSKDYIRNNVLALIRKYEKISGYKLKEIIVEEQGLCSKSSFYRILEELEQEEGIDVVKEGKEKVFFAKISATSHHR